jgi:signal peptidase I
VAERQPGSLEPADEPRTTGSVTDVSSGPSRHLDDAWVASADGSASRPHAGRKERSEADRGVLSFLRELPVLILLAFALALLLKTFVVQAFYIPSGSMEPTLMPGDRVLVEKVLYQPQHGDIIVFEDPHPGDQPDRGIVGGFLHWLSQGLGFSQPVDEDFIKRVIGLPGDTVELRHGKLFVNGDRVAQPYLAGPPDTRDYGPTTVPPGSLVVLGDNRLNSNDSRFGLGFVPEDRVIGKAFVLIWPPSRIGWLH